MNEKGYYANANTQRAQESVSGIDQSRRTVNSFMDKSTDNIEYLKSSLNELLSIYKELEDSNAKMTKAQADQLVKVKVAAEKLKDIENSKNIDISEQIKMVKEVAAVNTKAANDVMIIEQRSKKLSKERLAYLLEMKDIFESLKTDAAQVEKHMGNATGSKLEAFSKSLKKFSMEISQLSIARDLNSTLNAVVGSGKTSTTSIMNDVKKQFGMGSNAEFNTFKNELLGGVNKLNNSAGQFLYGADDLKWYMSNLSELGITNTNLAKSQLSAVVNGNKLLGLSLETQQGLLRQVKRTNNTALLTAVNNTAAAILQSNIGLSKDLVSKYANNATTEADALNAMGMDGASQQRWTVESMSAQSLISSKYGDNYATQMNSIMNDILAKGLKSDYTKILGGGNIQGILSNASTGAGAKSYEMLANAINNSDFLRAYSGSGISSNYGAEGVGVNAGLKSLYNRNINVNAAQAAGYTNNNDGIIEQLMKSTVIPIKEQLSNLMSTGIAQLPWGDTFSLANAAYALYITAYVPSVLKNLSLISKFVVKNNSNLGNILNSGKINSSILTKIGGAGLLTAGIFMAATDANKGYQQAIADGLTKQEAYLYGLQSFFCGSGDGIDNVLMNAMKFGIIGIGAALLLGIGGIPAAIIAGIGVILGGFLGIFGIGNKSKEKKKSNTGQPRSSYAIGNPSSDYSKGYPWSKTSSFNEERSYTNTQGKLINDIHTGVDLASSAGTPIGLAAGGIVSANWYDQYGGNQVKILGNDGLYYQYCHMQEPSKLQLGTAVNAGDLAGYMGMSGNVTGTHLHFQVNKGSTPIDPEPYITSSLFNPGAATSTSDTPNAGVNSSINIPRLNKNLVSSQTLQTASAMKAAQGFGQPAGQGEVVSSVRGGFSELMDLMKNLSARQDEQEQLMRLVAKPSSNNYKF